MSADTTQPAPAHKLPPLAKIAIEAGPLVLFFIANAWGGIFVATGVYMVAAAIALAVSWVLTRKIAIMPIVTLGFVLAFGGLTLLLADDTFIKMKVTIINALFGVTLIGGMLVGRSLLKPVFGEAMSLDAEGWRKLTWRWAFFFLAIAVLNEVIWRHVTTDTWAAFKVWGILPLTFLFAMAQVPLMQRHSTEPPEDEEAKTPPA